MHVPSVMTTPQAAIAAVTAAADLRRSADDDAAALGSPLDGVPAAPAGRADAETISLFEEAVGLHTRRLLGIARAIAGNRAAAEDVVQQALTNLYQHRARYDWANPGAAGALMRRAVVNEALRLLRQPRMTMVADEHPDDRGRRGKAASPADPMMDREVVARVRSAIDRLPEHFRAALVLCEYEGMAYVQIAEVLGCSIPQVKTWLHRARRQLAGMLQDVAPNAPDARAQRLRRGP
ncbi:MAG TPA: sigma-70 family RNA polymerase sigma factor [Humisphaera sp.]